MDCVVLTDEILNLNGIEVFATTDDDIFLAVYKEIEAILVLHCHIAGEEPAVLQNFGSGLLIIIVALHDTGPFDDEFADFALLYFLTVLVADLALPAIAGNADGTDLVDVFYTQMNGTGSDGFTQTIVGIDSGNILSSGGSVKAVPAVRRCA